MSEVNLENAGLDMADLTEVNLRKANLKKASFLGTELLGAYLSWADLTEANLEGANLFGAYLRGANLAPADLSGANLSRTNFSWADTRSTRWSKIAAIVPLEDEQPSTEDEPPPRRIGANLSGAKLIYADLSGADLSWANLSGANLSGAKLTKCNIFATSAWDIKLEGAIQSDLKIQDPAGSDSPEITVDNLELAQFIYLLLDNKKIRSIIDTISSKVVLILGRFTDERKVVLDAIRDKLRYHNYTPVLFDFERPDHRNFTETVRTLAHLARFIIADLTDPSSIPQELQAIIPTLAVPVQPVLLEGKREYAMFVDFLKTYHWVLPIYYYTDQDNLLIMLDEHVIKPAEQMARELENR